MSMEIGKKSRQIKVWQHTGERYDVECLTSTFKSGRCSVMTYLLPFYNASNELIGGKLVFQHDNSPIHTAKKNQIAKDNIQKQKSFPKTIDELKTALNEEW
ncbi:hypothetical protein Glove_140g66 [Diversispora epigaea]|uniref:Tc1-like transposase DDE domain-containing protein n=1 Tax=Diversispora epigaea TaxID=1348612 RepID=A0A397IV73_9GLOM|nr:hypothetical protein Glove_140g66 [Diversispora epigaea]